MSLSPTLGTTAPETQSPELHRPTVGFVSLGCPKNLVDSEVMMGLLHRAGGQLTPRAEDAEILVVNTCSFIDSAKQESVDTILEMVQHKISNGGRAQKLIVAGCLVERYRDEIRKNIPEVDAVVGTGELEAILEAAGLNRPQPAASNSPFAILTTAQIDRHASSVSQHSRPDSDSAQIVNEINSRPEGDAREATGRFSREAWDGATAPLPPISTPTRPLASSPPPAPRPTSRSPKAATTPAASASFRSCAASSAPAPSPASSPKPRASSPRASARSPSSARTPPATARTSRLSFFLSLQVKTLSSRPEARLCAVAERPPYW